MGMLFSYFKESDNFGKGYKTNSWKDCMEQRRYCGSLRNRFTVLQIHMLHFLHG